MSPNKLLLLFLVFPLFLSAQINDPVNVSAPTASKKLKAKDARIQLAKKRITDLKSGVLVIRLKTQKLKIGALEKLVKEGAVSKRPEFQAQLDRTIAERDSINQELVRFFSDSAYFDFCKVLFMYDSEIERYSRNEQSGYFLDKNLEVDPAISLEGQFSLLTYIGEYIVDGDQRTAYTSFITKDQHMSQLSPPFPAHVTFRKRQQDVSKKLKNKYVFVDLPIPHAIEKLNGVFKRFYLESQY